MLAFNLFITYLKKMIIYKKFKFNNNPYSIEEQVKQFNIVIKNHNLKNTYNCESIDKISFVLGSKPSYEWFKKMKLNVI